MCGVVRENAQIPLRELMQFSISCIYLISYQNELRGFIATSLMARTVLGWRLCLSHNNSMQTRAHCVSFPVPLIETATQRR